MVRPNRATQPHRRIARPSDHLPEIIRFYRDGLGMEMLSSFEGRGGFDGVMLGTRGGAYHLEFTQKRGHPAGRAPTLDNLLVFCLPDEQEWRGAVNRMESHGFASVPAFNPYWDVNGETFEDADGYRVVLQRAAWNAPTDSPAR